MSPGINLQHNRTLIESLKDKIADPNGPESFDREEVAALLRMHEALRTRLDRIVKISDGYQYELKVTTAELQQALSSIKTLQGIIPICASCKKVRADNGYWRQIERFLADNSEANLSHGLCPECTDNYLHLASIHEQPESDAPAFTTRLSDVDLENPVISQYIGIVNNRHFDKTPLRGDLLRLLEKYILLERRQRRIARISDMYQAEIKEIKEMAEREARVDYLTGLANRRDMYRVIDAEIARIDRYGGTLGLIMIDFDDFKKINDIYGHEAGDLTLQHGARLLQGVLRREDTCARWGGEEFMLIQPGSSREGVLCSAERLRLIVEQHPLRYKNHKIKTTVSIGVALYRPKEPLSNLINRVDASLYNAKKQGKNLIGPIDNESSGMVE